MSQPSPSVGLSPENDRRQIAKRKRSSAVKGDERKKVSRACDACKEKKVRCAGTQPCPRCQRQSIECLYNSAHRRGRPLPPGPGISFNEQEQGTTTAPILDHQHRKTYPTATHQDNNLESSRDPKRFPRGSQEADGAPTEGDYIGPTSGVAFLHRAQKRFQQDYAAIKSKNLEIQDHKKVSVYSFGDGLVPDYSNLKFSLPDGADANGLLDRYFGFAMPTYRFVHRPTIELWLESMYKEGSPSEKGVSNAKRAVVVLILATAKLYNDNSTDMLPDGQSKQLEESGLFFAEAERLLNNETGPVRVESVQARLAQCIHLLASSRINQAWYIFGTATQMISALGLHRKPYATSAQSTYDGADSDCRQQVFWSAYTLDRYLSVILGRPKIFRDEDIDQSLSEILNETNSNTSLIEARPNQSVSAGPFFHARLAKILGGISSDLYPTNQTIDTEWAESAKRWTAELKLWKESLPAFLDPTKVDPSMLVPIFQRQSTVLRLAYAHALILANRPALLSKFADLSRWQGIPLGEPTGSLKECIDAALVVVITVNELIEAGHMRKAFWFTHYISFCAISALYVYTIQQCLAQRTSTYGVATPDNRYFEAAVKCQKRVEDTTTISSPFRRYNVILDELKKEVMHQLAFGAVPASQENRDERGAQAILANRAEESRQIVLPSSRGTPLTITPTNADIYPLSSVASEASPPQYRNHQLQLQVGINNPLSTRPDLASFSIADDSMMMDLGFSGLSGELMGWSEFDSCAINWPEGLDIFEPDP